VDDFEADAVGVVEGDGVIAGRVVVLSRRVRDRVARIDKRCVETVDSE